MSTYYYIPLSVCKIVCSDRQHFGSNTCASNCVLLSQNGGIAPDVDVVSLSAAPPTTLTRVLTIRSMASSAKRRAVGLGENPKESEDSSEDNPEEEDESGEEDSEDSDEEINEVKGRSSCMPITYSASQPARRLAS